MTKILIGVLVLAGVGVIIFTTGDRKVEQREDEAMVENSSDTTDAPEEKDFNETTTITALMKKGGNYKCTFSEMTDVGTSTGTVFVNKERMRGDFMSAVKIEGYGDMGNFESHMISDGESMYSWNSMSSDGFKMVIDGEAKPSTDHQVSTNQKLDYTCVGWNVDESKFSLPTNITFKTM